MRQPLEAGSVRISRALASLDYSARRPMITAMKASRRREWERLVNRMRVVLPSTPVHGCRGLVLQCTQVTAPEAALPAVAALFEVEGQDAVAARPWQ
jgi:Magnesium chelatase, subunit ChlI